MLGPESIQERFEEKLGLKTRVRHLLAQGKMTRSALSQALNVGDDALRSALRRMPDVGNEGRSPHSAWYLTTNTEELAS